MSPCDHNPNQTLAICAAYRYPRDDATVSSWGQAVVFASESIRPTAMRSAILSRFSDADAALDLVRIKVAAPSDVGLSEAFPIALKPSLGQYIRANVASTLFSTERPDHIG
jgi:hypothetical protein